MRKNDLVWAACFAACAALFAVPASRELVVRGTKASPYLAGFIKFAILATMGELLAGRLSQGTWRRPKALVARAAVWGILGMAITLMFDIYGAGVRSALDKGLLPGRGSPLAFAFFVSLIMNLSFAPAMMFAHKCSDTWIDADFAKSGILARIDMGRFFSFTIAKTIPLFWIPAHTITFLLPPEYRVLAAAFLSIALGVLLALAPQAAPKPAPKSAPPQGQA